MKLLVELPRGPLSVGQSEEARFSIQVRDQAVTRRGTFKIRLTELTTIQGRPCAALRRDVSLSMPPSPGFHSISLSVTSTFYFDLGEHTLVSGQIDASYGESQVTTNGTSDPSKRHSATIRPRAGARRRSAAEGLILRVATRRPVGAAPCRLGGGWCSVPRER